MPRRTVEEAMETRARIAVQATAICAREGYDGLTLERVADEARVTRGAVYHHFGGKTGLFAAIAEERLRWMGAQIDRAVREAGDGWDAIVAGCLAFLRASQDPAYRRIVLVDAPAVLGTDAWRELDDLHTTSSLREGLAEVARAGPEVESTAGARIGPDAESTAGGRIGPDVAIGPAAEALSGAMNQLSLWVAGGNPLAEAERALLAILDAFRR